MAERIGSRCRCRIQVERGCLAPGPQRPPPRSEISEPGCHTASSPSFIARGRHYPFVACSLRSEHLRLTMIPVPWLISSRSRCINPPATVDWGSLAGALQPAARVCRAPELVDIMVEHAAFRPNAVRPYRHRAARIDVRVRQDAHSPPRRMGPNVDHAAEQTAPRSGPHLLRCRCWRQLPSPRRERHGRHVPFAFRLRFRFEGHDSEIRRALADALARHFPSVPLRRYIVMCSVYAPTGLVSCHGAFANACFTAGITLGDRGYADVTGAQTCNYRASCRLT